MADKAEHEETFSSEGIVVHLKVTVAKSATLFDKGKAAYLPDVDVELTYTSPHLTTTDVTAERIAKEVISGDYLAAVGSKLESAGNVAVAKALAIQEALTTGLRMSEERIS